MQTWDSTIYLVNVVLCVIILVLSLNYSKKSGNKLSLYIGVAFGLFGISHLITMINVKEYMPIITAVRLLAYSFIIMTLVQFLRNSQRNKQLLAENEKFKLLFSTSPDAVAITRMDTGEFLDINDGFYDVFGYRRDEIINKKVQIWANKENRQELLLNLQENDYYGNFETEMIHKNSSKLTVIISARRIVLDGHTCILSVIKDISFRKAAEEKLKELNSTKDKFFSILAHDLKNPLGSFYSVAELLNDEYDNIPEASKKQYLKIITESAKQLYSLLENLLTWSRSQRGLISFTPTEFDIYSLADNTIQILKLTASGKGIKLINNVSKDIYVNADMNLINAVLRNLMSNAIKFTDNGGEITISAIDSTSDYIAIFVRDAGVGISKDGLNNLFKIDKSVSTLGTNGESGTGLGLILCKEFIEMHKGKIWAESELGVGTTFYFTLPKL